MLECAMSGTRIDELLEAALDALQFANALFDFRQTRFGALLDAFDPAFAVDRKLEQFAYFGQCKAQFLGASNEAQAFDDARLVIAIARSASHGLGQQALAFVIANGVDADPGAFCKGAYGEVLCCLGIHVPMLNP